MKPPLSNKHIPLQTTLYPIFVHHPLTHRVKQFAQSLSNPLYLNHLASQKLLDSPEMIAYLEYLQYFKEPKYVKYLS